MTSEHADELIEELREPIAALPRHFGTEIAYHPQAQRPLIGPGITLARRTLIALLRWWIHAVVQRQDHINRLIVRALEQLQQASPAELERRVWVLEEQERARDSAATLDELESRALVQATSRPRPIGLGARQAVLEALRGRDDVLVLGAAPVETLRELRAAGTRVVVVDADVVAVRQALEAGTDARQLLPDVYLQEVADGSLGAVLSTTVVTQLPLGKLGVLLKRLTRALAPGSPLVLLAPDPADPAGLLGIWDDPASARPITATLLERVLTHAGFADVTISSTDSGEAGPTGSVPLLIAVARRS